MVPFYYLNCVKLSNYFILICFRKSWILLLKKKCSPVCLPLYVPLLKDCHSPTIALRFINTNKSVIFMEESNISRRWRDILKFEKCWSLRREGNWRIRRTFPWCKDVNQEQFYLTFYANLGFEMGKNWWGMAAQKPFYVHSALQCRIPISKLFVNSKSNKQRSVQIDLTITTGKLSLIIHLALYCLDHEDF